MKKTTEQTLSSSSRIQYIREHYVSQLPVIGILANADSLPKAAEMFTRYTFMLAGGVAAGIIVPADMDESLAQKAGGNFARMAVGMAAGGIAAQATIDTVSAIRTLFHRGPQEPLELEEAEAEEDLESGGYERLES